MKNVSVTSLCLMCGVGILVSCSPKHEPTPGGVAVSSVAAPVASAMAANAMDCLAPVGPSDAAKALKVKFGADAQIGKIPGPEGTVLQGIILYKADPKRHVDVVYWDAAMEHVSDVSPAGEASTWSGPGGLHAGSTLEEVEAANGGPFDISGFGWDYGGRVIDWKGGKLGQLAGGCHLSLEFTFAGVDGANPPQSLFGDKSIPSGDPVLRKAHLTVTGFSLGWALPPGVKDDAPVSEGE